MEAAQALANIEKDLIQKKLEADVAALEEEWSQSSQGGRESLRDVSQKVEKWMNQSEQDKKPPENTLASSRRPVEETNDTHLHPRNYLRSRC